MVEAKLRGITSEEQSAADAQATENRVNLLEQCDAFSGEVCDPSPGKGRGAYGRARCYGRSISLSTSITPSNVARPETKPTTRIRSRGVG